MIHLSTLSTALLRPAADESVVSPLEATADGDTAPANGQSYEPRPSLPSPDDIKGALQALRDREVGSAKHESAVAGMAGSRGTGGASPFVVFANLFNARALNPQPLPPVDPKLVIAGTPGDPCAPFALNPQPLPPGDPKRALAFQPGDPCYPVALNPQPLPPRESMLAKPSMINDPLTAAGLNPQPLPPKGDSLKDIGEPFFPRYRLPPYAE